MKVTVVMIDEKKRHVWLKIVGSEFRYDYKNTYTRSEFAHIFRGEWKKCIGKEYEFDEETGDLKEVGDE